MKRVYPFLHRCRSCIVEKVPAEFFDVIVIIPHRKAVCMIFVDSKASMSERDYPWTITDFESGLDIRVSRDGIPGRSFCAPAQFLFSAQRMPCIHYARWPAAFHRALKAFCTVMARCRSADRAESRPTIHFLKSPALPRLISCYVINLRRHHLAECRNVLEDYKIRQRV